MAYFAILQPDARAAARLSGSLSPPHRVAVKQSWSALERLLSAEPVDAGLADLDFPTRDAALGRLARLRDQHPDLALMAYADITGQDFEWYRLGSLGLDGVLTVRDTRSAPAVREIAERALASARAREIAGRLPHARPDAARRALAWAVEHAGGRPCVSAFASALGHPPSGLRRLLRDVGLPPPNRVLLWGRLLAAGSLLNRDGRTVEETAYALGYTTANALTRAMRRETGLTPTDVARRGGAARVLKSLLRR